MISYIDTSFLWKLYVNEIHSQTSVAWFKQYRGEVALCELSDIEMISALHRRLPHAQAVSIQRIYEEDNDVIGVYRRFSIDSRVWVLAKSIAEQYGASVGLRSLDTIHLATALHHKVDSFATYDVRLSSAAKAAGLQVVP